MRFTLLPAPIRPHETLRNYYCCTPSLRNNKNNKWALLLSLPAQRGSLSSELLHHGGQGLRVDTALNQLEEQAQSLAVQAGVEDRGNLVQYCWLLSKHQHEAHACEVKTPGLVSKSKLGIVNYSSDGMFRCWDIATKG